MKKLLFLLLLITLFCTLSTLAMVEPIKVGFKSEDDLALLSKIENIETSFKDGILKIKTDGVDPTMTYTFSDTKPSTDDYPYFKVKIKPLVNDGNQYMAQVFFKTDNGIGMGEVGTYFNFPFEGKEEWQEITIPLKDIKDSKWNGNVEILRFDPHVGTANSSIEILVEYFGLFPPEKEPEPEKDAKPLIFPFHNIDDYTNFITGINQGDIDFQDGYLKITSTGNDTFLQRELSEEQQFAANSLPIYKVRFKPLAKTGENALGQFLFNTTKLTQMGDKGTYENYEYTLNGEWQDVIVDLRNIKESQWHGVVTLLRFDIICSEGYDILVDYIGLFNSVEAAEKFSLGNDFPISNSEEFVYRYGLQNIIIPMNTISPEDTVKSFALESDSAENPEKIIGGPVVFYTDNSGKESIVALSYNNTISTTYVARKPGNYRLGYSTKIYNDISGHWGYPTIIFASNRKLFGGTSQTEFSPDMTMTRGMFITVLGRMHGLDTSLYLTSSGYSDVNANEYYAPYVTWSKELGLADGVTKTSFAPEEPITRSDMALIISNYIKKYNYTFKTVGDVSAFDDIASLSEEKQNAISQIQSVGIINGKDKGIFDPNGISTRAEVASVMSRLIKAILGIDLTFYETSETSREFIEPERYRFRIGAFVPHNYQMKGVDEKQVRYLAEAGIDFSILGFDNFYTRPLSFQKSLLRWYSIYGIEAIHHDSLGASKIVHKSGGGDIFDSSKAKNMWYASTPSYGGNSFVDEPGTEHMEELGKSIEEYKTLFPGKVPFVNLLPMYANSAQLTGGAWQAAIEYYESVDTEYQEYLDAYVKYVDTDYISVDIYPLFNQNGKKITYSDYIKSIEIVANACRNSGREFWVFVQSCAWSYGTRVPSRADIFWQDYTMLSFGATNIIYYIFGFYSGHIGTPISENGEKNPTYDYVKEANFEMHRISNIYMQYKNLGAFNVNSTPEKTPYLEMNTPYKNFAPLQDIKTDDSLLIGCFEKKQGTGYAFTIVNYNDLDSEKSAEIKFKIQGSKVTTYLGGYPNILTPANDGYYTISLECGMGVFITID